MKACHLFNSQDHLAKQGAGPIRFEMQASPFPASDSDQIPPNRSAKKTRPPIYIRPPLSPKDWPAMDPLQSFAAGDKYAFPAYGL